MCIGGPGFFISCWPKAPRYAASVLTRPRIPLSIGGVPAQRLVEAARKIVIGLRVIRPEGALERWGQLTSRASQAGDCPPTNECMAAPIRRPFVARFLPIKLVHQNHSITVVWS
jgi:hypothetical protein